MADGVGSSEQGGEASRLAVEGITEYVTQSMRAYYAAEGVDDEGFAASLREAAEQVHAELVKRAKADPANALHVAAPMAGGVVSVAVKPGQKVKAGDALLALEAMKMETHLNAERDAEIEQVLVHAGDQIDAKDLLVVFKP